MEVRRLELQHLENTCTIYFIRSSSNFLWGTIHATETSVDQLLAELVEQVECTQMCTGRDFDQLCKSIPHLALRQSTQETEVEECVSRRVISTKAVLVVAVVYGDLNGD